MQKREAMKTIMNDMTKIAQGSKENIPKNNSPKKMYQFKAIIEEKNRPNRRPSSSMNPRLNPMNPLEAIKKKANRSKNNTTDLFR